MSKNNISDILFGWNTWIEGNKKDIEGQNAISKQITSHPATLRQKASPIEGGGGFDDGNLSIIQINIIRHDLLFT